MNVHGVSSRGRTNWAKHNTYSPVTDSCRLCTAVCAQLCLANSDVGVSDHYERNIQLLILVGFEPSKHTKVMPKGNL